MTTWVMLLPVGTTGCSCCRSYISQCYHQVNTCCRLSTSAALTYCTRVTNNTLLKYKPSKQLFSRHVCRGHVPVTKQKAGTLTDMAPDFALYTYICLHIAEHFRQPVLHFGMRASSGGPNVIFSIDTSTLMKLQSMRMGDRSPALCQRHYLHFADSFYAFNSS